MVTLARKDAPKNAETGGTRKTEKVDENGNEDLRRNLTQIPYIQYLIIF